MEKFGNILFVYHFCTTMARTMDYIHFRISPVIHDIIAKISFDTGLSKQDVIRQMIINQITEKYNINLLMDMQQIKEKIQNEKTNL